MNPTRNPIMSTIGGASAPARSKSLLALGRGRLPLRPHCLYVPPDSIGAAANAYLGARWPHNGLPLFGAGDLDIDRRSLRSEQERDWAVHERLPPPLPKARAKAKGGRRPR